MEATSQVPAESPSRASQEAGADAAELPATLPTGLGRLLNPLTPEQIVRLATDPDTPADVRRQAYARIARTKAAAEPVYRALFRATLAEPGTDPTVAVTCALALARVGQPEDAAAVALLLKSAEPYARWQAAAALQRLHYPPVIPALIQTATTDEDADARAAAAYALGQYPRRDVFDALTRVLDDANPAAARAAQQALQQITGHDAGDDPRAWLTWADEQGADLFAAAAAQTYTWQPYDPPKSFPRNLLFFLPDPDTPPRNPRGLDPL